MTTTKAPIPTPTHGTIPAGVQVTLIERLPGYFLVCQGSRRSALMSAEQVDEVTE